MCPEGAANYASQLIEATTCALTPPLAVFLASNEKRRCY